MAINNTVSGLFSSPAKPALSGLFSAPAKSALPKPQSAAQVTGGMSVAPTSVTAKAPVVSPVKSTTSSASSAGSYKGVAITPGSDADVAAQIARIDKGGDSSVPLTKLPPLSPQPLATVQMKPEQPKTTFPGLVSTLATRASGGSPEVQAAIKRKQDLETAIAGKYADIESQAIPLEFQQGREQALSRQFASQQAAAESAVSNALSAQGQELTALGTAAGLAAPNTAAYGQTVFNPLTGQYEGGAGTLDPQSYASQLASAVASGRMPYNDAVSSLGYAGGAGKAFLDQAILAAGGNLTQLQSQIAGQQAVLGTLPQLQAANTAAEGIEKTIKSFIDQNPDLNPSDAAFANSVNQWLNGKQLTDPRYQTLFNYLSEYTNTLAPVLGVGGDPTNLKTEIAQSFLNARASGGSIKGVIENMAQLARDKVANIRSGATGGGVVAGGTSPGTVPTAAGASAFAEEW